MPADRLWCCFEIDCAVRADAGGDGFVVHAFSRNVKEKHERSVNEVISLHQERRISIVYFIISTSSCFLLILYDERAKWLCPWSALGASLAVVAAKQFIRRIARKKLRGGSTKEADCGNEQDKAMITKQIMSNGGFERLDQTIDADILKVEQSFRMTFQNSSAGMADMGRGLGQVIFILFALFTGIIITSVYMIIQTESGPVTLACVSVALSVLVICYSGKDGGKMAVGLASAAVIVAVPTALVHVLRYWFLVSEHSISAIIYLCLVLPVIALQTKQLCADSMITSLPGASGRAEEAVQMPAKKALQAIAAEHISRTQGILTNEFLHFSGVFESYQNPQQKPHFTFQQNLCYQTLQHERHDERSVCMPLILDTLSRGLRQPAVVERGSVSFRAIYASIARQFSKYAAKSDNKRYSTGKFADLHELPTFESMLTAAAQQRVIAWEYNSNVSQSKYDGNNVYEFDHMYSHWVDLQITPEDFGKSWRQNLLDMMDPLHCFLASAELTKSSTFQKFIETKQTK